MICTNFRPVVWQFFKVKSDLQTLGKVKVDPYTYWRSEANAVRQTPTSKASAYKFVLINFATKRLHLPGIEPEAFCGNSALTSRLPCLSSDLSNYIP